VEGKSLGFDLVVTTFDEVSITRSCEQRDPRKQARKNRTFTGRATNIALQSGLLDCSRGVEEIATIIAEDERSKGGHADDEVRCEVRV